MSAAPEPELEVETIEYTVACEHCSQPLCQAIAPPCEWYHALTGTAACAGHLTSARPVRRDG